MGCIHSKRLNAVEPESGPAGDKADDVKVGATGGEPVGGHGTGKVAPARSENEGSRTSPSDGDAEPRDRAARATEPQRKEVLGGDSTGTVLAGDAKPPQAPGKATEAGHRVPSGRPQVPRPSGHAEGSPARVPIKGSSSQRLKATMDSDGTRALAEEGPDTVKTASSRQLRFVQDDAAQPSPSAASDKRPRKAQSSGSAQEELAGPGAADKADKADKDGTERLLGSSAKGSALKTGAAGDRRSQGSSRRLQFPDEADAAGERKTSGVRKAQFPDEPEVRPPDKKGSSARKLTFPDADADGATSPHGAGVGSPGGVKFGEGSGEASRSFHRRRSIGDPRVTVRIGGAEIDAEDSLSPKNGGVEATIKELHATLGAGQVDFTAINQELLGKSRGGPRTGLQTQKSAGAFMLNSMGNLKATSDDEDDSDSAGGAAESVHNLKVPAQSRRPSTPSGDGDDGASRHDAKSVVAHEDKLRMGKVGEGASQKIFVNHYAVMKHLGAGANGHVNLCWDLREYRLVAVKAVYRERRKMTYSRAMGGGENPEVAIKREIATLESLMDRNIVEIYEVIDDPDSPTIMVVMEYVEGGPVQEEYEDETELLSELVARGIFRQLLLGLRHIHSKGVIHGDVKPANLAFGGDGVVKLIDFGSSVVCKQVYDEKSRSTVIKDELLRSSGTPAFLPPEVCMGEKYSGRAADLWAAGVTLYHLIFGKLPFGKKSGMTVYAMYDAIMDDPLVFPESPPTSDALRSLLTTMLDKERKNRLDLEGVLAHEWCNVIDLPPEVGAPGVAEEAEDGEGTFETLDANMARVLASLPGLERRTFQPGEFLVREGEEGDAAFFVLKGKAMVLKLAPDDFFKGIDVENAGTGASGQANSAAFRLGGAHRSRTSRGTTSTASSARAARHLGNGGVMQAAGAGGPQSRTSSQSRGSTARARAFEALAAQVQQLPFRPEFAAPHPRSQSQMAWEDTGHAHEPAARGGRRDGATSARKAEPAGPVGPAAGTSAGREGVDAGAKDGAGDGAARRLRAASVDERGDMAAWHSEQRRQKAVAARESSRALLAEVEQALGVEPGEGEGEGAGAMTAGNIRQAIRAGSARIAAEQRQADADGKLPTGSYLLAAMGSMGSGEVGNQRAIEKALSGLSRTNSSSNAGKISRKTSLKRTGSQARAASRGQITRYSSGRNADWNIIAREEEDEDEDEEDSEDGEGEPKLETVEEEDSDDDGPLAMRMAGLTQALATRLGRDPTADEIVKELESVLKEEAELQFDPNLMSPIFGRDKDDLRNDLETLIRNAAASAAAVGQAVRDKEMSDLQVVAHMGRWDIAGEMALLSGGRRCASVRASTFLEALVLRKGDLVEAMRQLPFIQEHLKLIIAKRKANCRMFEAYAALGELHVVLQKRDQDARSRAVSRAASRAASRFQSRLPSPGELASDDDDDYSDDFEEAGATVQLTDEERGKIKGFGNDLMARLAALAEAAGEDECVPLRRKSTANLEWADDSDEDDKGARGPGPAVAEAPAVSGALESVADVATPPHTPPAEAGTPLHTPPAEAGTPDGSEAASAAEPLPSARRGGRVVVMGSEQESEGRRGGVGFAEANGDGAKDARKGGVGFAESNGDGAKETRRGGVGFASTDEKDEGAEKKAPAKEGKRRGVGFQGPEDGDGKDEGDDGDEVSPRRGVKFG